MSKRRDRYREREKRKREGSSDGLETKGKSTLADKVVRLLGFCRNPHPEKAGYIIQVTFWEIEVAEFVICAAEFKGEPQSPFEESLGKMFPGYQVAPTAERHLEGVTRSELRKLFEKSMEDSEFTWWEGV